MRVSLSAMADWSKILSRGNVVDRRGISMSSLGGLGIGGVVLLMGVTYLLGGSPLDILLQLDPSQLQQSAVSPEEAAQYEGTDEYEVFVSTVLGSNNDLWEIEFNTLNRTYTEPSLVLFRGGTQSECGGAVSQVGPHYCPLDQTIYLDETFFEELQTRFDAKGGDVAEAYVIAHEVGHHVQNQLGLLDERSTAAESIAVELQADCLAGVWAHSIKTLSVLSPGEIEEALNAAAAVGDDSIQQKTEGEVHPETWTHGSSAQRVDSFNKGFTAGKLQACTG